MDNKTIMEAAPSNKRPVCVCPHNDTESQIWYGDGTSERTKDLPAETAKNLGVPVQDFPPGKAKAK
jgi:hypothetical protein